MPNPKKAAARANAVDMEHRPAPVWFKSCTDPGDGGYENRCVYELGLYGSGQFAAGMAQARSRHYRERHHACRAYHPCVQASTRHDKIDRAEGGKRETQWHAQEISDFTPLVAAGTLVGLRGPGEQVGHLAGIIVGLFRVR